MNRSARSSLRKQLLLELLDHLPSLTLPSNASRILFDKGLKNDFVILRLPFARPMGRFLFVDFDGFFFDGIYHLIGGTNGSVRAKNQQKKNTIGVCTINCSRP
jgi:hypothetical protein